MSIKFKLKQLIYFCNDMKAMTDFYAGVLGLPIMKNDDYPLDEWVELAGNGFKLCLHKAYDAELPRGSSAKLVFDVDDVAAARSHLAHHGAKMGTHHHWGQLDACDGHDPEGNVFQIAGPPTGT